MNTIGSYSHCIRQVSTYFDICPDNLTPQQLKEYFLQLSKTRSWSLVKISRNAIQFLYRHVLKRPWEWVDIVKHRHSPMCSFPVVTAQWS